MAFTDNQLRAITTSGNIIVSAGAGSGKTTVMIARIIDKLKKGVSLDEMLIVTFTRASAADMRVKLTDKLYELKADPKFRAIAENALELLPACNIGTLHSYCQRLVRMYFFAADLDPSAAVCEECEADAIKQRVVSDAVECAWNAADPCFMTMYDMLCVGRSDDGVKAAVGDILEFALTMPDPQAYLADTRADDAYFAELDGIVTSRREAIAKKISALKLDLAAAGMEKHVMGADDMLAYMDGITDTITYTSHKARHDYTDELNEQYKNLKTRCKKFREFIVETENAKAVESAPYSFALRAVAADALQRYAERKRSLGKIDYSDLEHGAYNVLRDSECLSGITENIKYVFIDEFQDVNPLQSAIAECFRAAGAEMFVVGDIKQSIYGFRRCSPEHFKRAIASPHYTHIPLTDNFRSSEAVINFVNSVFDGVMTKDFGGVDYSDAAQRLVWGNKSITDGKTAFYAVDESDDEPTQIDTVAVPSEGNGQEKRDGYSVVTDAVAAVDDDSQAELVADCIFEYITRSPAPKVGNIAVLVRSVKSRFCVALGRELDRRSVKYCLEKRSSAKSFPEVVALMDILRCADNRLDDIALYTAMRSAMGGFSDEELARIAAEGESACRAAFVKPIGSGQRVNYAFWQKVNAYNGELKDRVDKFIAARDKIVDFAINHDCADVLGFITSEIDYFQQVYEQGGSAAAVDALIRFAADRACDMHAFLTYFDGNNIELSASGGGDAVAITTMHSSKGLEYDLVIVADTNKQFSNTDKEKRVLISENGVFVKIPDEDTHLLKKSAPWMVENLTYSDRQRAEELRLFYVALTRAKRELIVCGKKSAFAPVAPEDSKCMMNFLSRLTPDKIDVKPVPIGDVEELRPYDGSIAAAVSARHKQVEEYNALRLKCALPVKTCVTAVAHDEWEEGDYTAHTKVLTVDDRDTDKNEKDKNGDSAASMLRGTAYHRAMELADFVDFDMDELRRTCENFSLVDEREIATAVAAMKELTAGSAFIAKERYFIVNLPAAQVYGDEGITGNVLVQGVIDLLIVDKDGNATIVDYKTGNPVSLNNNAYRKQLELYSAAVERVTPYKVKKAVLYSFAAGKLIQP
ncbi:MAG: UvrD-helicase domain-containing protein [Clostridiales bacterium]|nr:UvrD-helicase domain-containing protein [Clostridiales bacterium]